MDTNTLLSLIIVAGCLTARGVFAQPAAVDIPSAVESLPASSPYGESTAIRNIPYVTNASPRQNFDLILPKSKVDQPFPLIVWIHGGAWMMGIKEWDNVKYLVRHGYAIANIDYRFSTEARFPAQIQDCNAALNFILTHASEYGINSRRFVVAGGSAGGHLALLLGLAREERDFGADPSIQPLAILDFFGPTDLNEMMGDLKTIHSEKGIEQFEDVVPKLLGATVEQSPEKAKAASPITYVRATSPPVLILHGSSDESVPPAQSRRLLATLNQAGVKNQIIVVDAGHDGPLFSTPELESRVVAFLNDVLEKPQSARPH